MSLIDKLFSETYYETKNFEKDGKIYELIGIKTFKRVVMGLVSKKKVQNYNLMAYSIKGIEDYEKKSRNNEKIHFFGLIIMLFLTLPTIFFSDSILGIIQIFVLTLINIGVNLYPIFLQRYNRIRLKKVLSRMKFSEKLTDGS